MTSGTGYYYTIRKGDTLTRLATIHHLPSWETIWNDPKNARIRHAHRSPSLIYPGESIWIPAAVPPLIIGTNAAGSISISLINIKQLTFTTDFDGLLKNDADWKYSGTPINEPKWDLQHSDPIIHKLDSIIECDAVFEMKGKTIPSIKADITGNGPARFLTFEGKGVFAPGETTIHVKSIDKIWNKVNKYDLNNINWILTKAALPILYAGVTYPINLYAIMGQSINSGEPEDGTTTKRMELAIKWVLECNTNLPVDIVDKLFSKFPFYVLGFKYLPKEQRDELNRDPILKNQLFDAGFASYMKSDIGGAWLLGQFSKFGGECQAIVRLIKGILHQIGCPGTIGLKYVNSEV